MSLCKYFSFFIRQTKTKDHQAIFFMQSYRTLQRLPATAATRARLTAPHKRTMAFFPRGFCNSGDASFAPLFRLLDDFEQHSRQVSPRAQTQARLISPRFDVQETPESYELHGEFPGLSQENISLEFTDTQTLTVRAHQESHSESSNIPAVEAAPAPKAVTDAETSSTHSQQPTVEDEAEDGVVVESHTPASSEAQTQVAEAAQTQPQQQPKQPQPQYHVRERSVGQFYRQFSFPGRIDQDAVTASMKNGILSVIVPKAKKHEARKIAIN